MSKNKKRQSTTFKYIILIGGVVICALLTTIICNINSVDPNSDLVQNLYTYLGDNYGDYCDGLPLYSEKEKNYDTLSYPMKMCLAYIQVSEAEIEKDSLKKAKKKDVCTLTHDKTFRLDDDKDICSVETISIENLNKAYYKLFGKEIDTNIDFELNGSKMCYYEAEKSRYICGRSEMQTIQLGWTPTTYRMITKVKEKGSQLMIYDYYLAINNNQCYVTNDGSQINAKCSDKINEDTEVNSRLVAKYGQKYLHVFEKDSEGNYHWISSTAK